MNTGLNQGSAKIYQFPKRARPATELSKKVDIALGSSWYHDEAIREAVGDYGTHRETVRTSAQILPLTFPRH